MKNLIIYSSWLNVANKLTDEQAGKLFKAFHKWLNGEEVTFDDGVLQGFWMGIEPNLENMENNYQKKVEKNRENGKLGGRPKNPKNPNGFIETQITQTPLKEKENNKENNKENKKEKEIESEELSALKELFDIYQSTGELIEDDRILFYDLYKLLKNEGYFVNKYSIVEYGII